MKYILHEIKVRDVSPVFHQEKDESGNGIMGFTVHYTSGSFENVIHSYSPETRKQIAYDMENLHRSYQMSISSGLNKHATKTDNTKQSHLKRRKA